MSDSVSYRLTSLALIAVVASVASRGAPGIAPAAFTRVPSSPDLIPIERLLGGGGPGQAVSPDGHWLAFQKPYQGRPALYVRPIAGGSERPVLTDGSRLVRGFSWSADSRSLVFVRDSAGNENFHLFAVSIAADAPPVARDVTPYAGIRVELLGLPASRPNEAFVLLNKRDASQFDAAWVNLATGTLRPVVENHSGLSDFVLDRRGTVRLALQPERTGMTTLMARETDTSPWRRITTYGADDNLQLLRIESSGRYALAVSDRDRDLAALVRIDLTTGKESVIERDPDGWADLTQVLFSGNRDTVVATIYEADTVRIYAQTRGFRRDLRALDSLGQGRPQFWTTTRDGALRVVTLSSPSNAGTTYLYSSHSHAATVLSDAGAPLAPYRLPPTRPIAFHARDGMTIRGYLTMPDSGPSPLIIDVHGGPWARFQWRYDPMTHLLANRGYAVLRVNFRGSTGFGKRYMQAAIRQFAKAMQTDLLDAAAWAEQQSLVPRGRIGIRGVSYGGYAVLAALAYAPDAFACGVEQSGPSDLASLIQSFPTYWSSALGPWYRYVGNPANPADREEMRQRSPLYAADRIVRPLLITHGANDPRVRKNQADAIAMALHKRGVPVEYLLAPGEGHGNLSPQNQAAVLRAVEQFFARCLGGRVQEPAAPAIDERLATLRVNLDTLVVRR